MSVARRTTPWHGLRDATAPSRSNSADVHHGHRAPVARARDSEVFGLDEEGARARRASTSHESTAALTGVNVFAVTARFINTIRPIMSGTEAWTPIRRAVGNNNTTKSQ